jgi:hypothetical protein
MRDFVKGTLDDHEEPDFSMKDQRERAKGMAVDLPSNPEDWPEDDDVSKP